MKKDEENEFEEFKKKVNQLEGSIIELCQLNDFDTHHLICASGRLILNYCLKNNMSYEGFENYIKGLLLDYKNALKESD